MKITLSTVTKIGSILLIAVVAILVAYQGGERNGMGAYGMSTESSSSDTGPVIGIDLGTKTTVMSISRNGGYEIIPNDQGYSTTPSIVAFNQYDTLIGDSAYNQMQLNPQNTIFDAKRLIGRTFNDPIVQKDMKLYPFNVVSNKDGQALFQVKYKNSTKLFLPEQISAMILSKMKQIASKYLGENVNNAVITVPAYFNDNQRMATKLAGQIAGLNVLRIINEPTAASIAFGLNNIIDKDKASSSSSEKNIIVYDLGGGTFDVSLLIVEDGVFDVIATNGDTHLGGEDFDANIINYFVKKFQQKHKIDLKQSEYMRGLNKLRKECEKAKRALSSPDTKQVKIEIDNIVNGIDFNEYLTQARFESLNHELFLKTLSPLKQVLNDAKFTINDIDEVVMVGGSTRIPKIQSLVSKFFKGKKLNFGINPDEAVAHGAGIQAAMLSNHISQTATNKDHVVLDVTPLSLGIKTAGDVFSKVIYKNEKTPTKKSQIFTTYQDNQNTVSIEVYQGERPMVKDNIFLGKFDLNGINLAPRGVPQIEVTFNIDADGIVRVEAKDKNQPSNHAQITIDQQNARPSDDTIQQMLKDQKMFEEDDQILFDKITLKNTMESNAYQIKNEFGNKDDRINEACDEIIDWLESIVVNSLDIDDLKDKKNEFEDIVNPIIEQMQSNSYHDDMEDDYHYYDHEDL